MEDKMTENKAEVEDKRSFAEVKVEQDDLMLRKVKLTDEYLKTKLSIQEMVTAGRMELARARFLGDPTSEVNLHNATIGNSEDEYLANVTVTTSGNKRSLVSQPEDDDTIASKVGRFLSLSGIENYKKSRALFKVALEHYVALDNLDKEIEAVMMKISHNNKRLEVIRAKLVEKMSKMAIGGN